VPGTQSAPIFIGRQLRASPLCRAKNQRGRNENFPH
jgi:hypothetical protein